MTAESGAEALRVLARDRIDLVISDLRMDEMDGLALFSEIQKHQPGLPVIILTAHGSIPDAVAATQQGGVWLFDQAGGSRCTLQSDR